MFSETKKFSINRKEKKWVKFLIGAATLFCLLFMLNIFASPIKNFVYAISSPIQKTFWVAGESSSSYLGSLARAGSLEKENENLKGENQKLLAEVSSLQSIIEGNQAQSVVSATCQNNGFKLVMAGVTGLEDNDILSINKGSADKISIGMPVISQEGVLFGKIVKVYKNFSDVMLVSSKSSVVNVKVQQADPEIDGVVKGSGGLSAYLDLIPINSEINPQQVLVTSSIEKLFPKDLLVGTIIQKQKDDQKPFQGASIRLFSDVKTAGNLFVITNYKQ